MNTLPKYTAVTYRLPSKLLREEQAKDLFIQAVKGYIEEKAIPTDPEVLQILIRTGKHFTMDKKILYRRTILRHFGVTRTIDRVKRIGYWKGWRDDVIDYCRKCLRMPVYKLRGPFSFLVVDALRPFPLTLKEIDTS
ncbi:unnamed protein product [Aphanomyces euteiches]